MCSSDLPMHPIPQSLLPPGYILQVSVINAPCFMHAAGQLVQVVAGIAHQRHHLLQLRQFQTHHIAVQGHLAQIPREGWQSIRIWEYCPFTVSRYCRRIVSRLMAFTRDTSMPESWMSAGIRSTPSGWCRMPSPGRSGSSMRMRPIASERVKGSLSGCGLPMLMVRLACGSYAEKRVMPRN